MTFQIIAPERGKEGTPGRENSTKVQINEQFAILWDLQAGTVKVKGRQ